MNSIRRVDVAYTLVLDSSEQKVLMVENETAWSLPGGAREPGETLMEAATREFKEETGFDVVVHDIVHVSERLTDSNHLLFITFRGEITGGQLETTDSEIQRIEWKRSRR